MAAVDITPLVTVGGIATIYLADKAITKLREVTTEAIGHVKKMQFDKNTSLAAKMAAEIVDEEGMLKVNDSKTIAAIDSLIGPITKHLADRKYGRRASVPADAEKLLSARKAEEWRLEPNAAGYRSLAQLLEVLDNDHTIAEKYNFKQRDTFGTLGLDIPDSFTDEDAKNLPSYIFPKGITINENRQLVAARNTEGKWDMESLTLYFQEHKDLPPEFNGWETDTRLPQTGDLSRSEAIQRHLEANFGPGGSKSFSDYYRASDMGMTYVMNHLTQTLGMMDSFLPEPYPAAERTPEIIEEAALNALEKIHSNRWSLYELMGPERLFPAEFTQWDLADKRGDTVAHMAAKFDNFDQWGESAPAHDGMFPEDFDEWGEPTSKSEGLIPEDFDEWSEPKDDGGSKKPGGPKM